MLNYFFMRRFSVDWLLTAARWVLFGAGVVLPLAVSSLVRDGINLPKAFLLQSMVLLALLLWVIRMTGRKEVVWRKSILDWPLLALAVSWTIASLLSVDQTQSWFGTTAGFVMHAVNLLAVGLWFWLLLQLATQKHVPLLVQLLLLSGILAGAMWLLPQASWLTVLPGGEWLQHVAGINLVSSSNSLLGIFLAAIGVLALGWLLPKRHTVMQSILPITALLVSTGSMMRMGFTLVWIIFAVGCGLVLALGISHLGSVRISILSLTFFLFLVSLLLVFFGTPDIVKRPLPVEVGLGARPSWDIALSTVGKDIKSFFFGSGPGTFRYDFSQFRTPIFNQNGVLWSTRFGVPYSTVLAVLPETGILSAVIFFGFILLTVGTIFAAWVKTRPVILFERDHASTTLPTLVIAATWMTLTVGLCLSFFDLVPWWLWWHLTAILIIALTSIVPSLMEERIISLPASPQYALVFSFGVVLIFTVMIIFGIQSSKMYIAEVHYGRASVNGNITAQQSEVEQALTWRPNYPPYQLTLANIYLQQATIAFQQNPPQTDTVALKLSQAVNTAKLAVEKEGNNVDNWETLAVMYLNARALAPEANGWARDALLKAIALEPSNPILPWRLAAVEENDNHLAEAEKAYRKAIELKPDYLAAYAGLSALYERQNKVDDAIAVYAPILSLVQNEPELLFNLGRLFFNRRGKDDNARAEQVLQRAVQLTPNYSNALYSLGLLYERVGQRDRAIEYFTKVKNLNPNNPDVAKKLRSL